MKFKVDEVPEGISTATRSEVVRHCLAPDEDIWARRTELHGETTCELQFGAVGPVEISEEEFQSVKTRRIGDPVRRTTYESDITDATDPTDVKIYKAALHHYTDNDFWIAEIEFDRPERQTLFKPFDWLGDDVTDTFTETDLI